MFKLLFSFMSSVAALTVLAGCAASTTNRPVIFLQLEKAEVAIARQQFDVAYRFLEDGLVITNHEAKTKALNLVKQYPQLISAGLQTFAAEEISKTLSSHGEEAGVDLERRRLKMFRVIASDNDYESAKSNVDLKAVNVDRRREEQLILAEEKRKEQLILENEKRKRAEEVIAEMARQRLEIKTALVEAAKNSKFLCKNQSECQKAFSLTQIFISDYSDMKIQVATDAIIETYGPTLGKVGLKARKIPGRGDSAEIVLTAACRGEEIICDALLLPIYRSFPVFIQYSLYP